MLRGGVTLLRREFAHSRFHKMKSFLYLCLVTLPYVKAQISLPAVGGLASPPTTLAGLPIPKNAAFWQQAIAMDAEKNLTSENQLVYAQLAWIQNLENSSNSYLSGASSSMDAAPYMSQSLQYVQAYPTRFDQAQSSDPERTSSKRG